MEALFRIWSSNWSLTFVGHPRDLEFVSSVASAERERLSSFIRVIKGARRAKKKHKKKKSRRAVHDSVYQGNIFSNCSCLSSFFDAIRRIRPRSSGPASLGLANFAQQKTPSRAIALQRLRIPVPSRWRIEIGLVSQQPVAPYSLSPVARVHS